MQTTAMVASWTGWKLAGTPVEPEPGLARNMLMSAVMGDEIDEIDVSYEPFDLQAGDLIMICSDGMDTLSEGKFLQFSDWSETPKECTEALLNAVTEANMPKQDNTTIVVVDIIEKEATAVPPPQAAEPLPSSPARRFNIRRYHTRNVFRKRRKEK